MKVNLSMEDLKKFPPDVQKQILDELEPKPPDKPLEWYQVGYKPPAQGVVDPIHRTPIIQTKSGEPIIPHRAQTDWWEKKTLRGSTRPVTPHKVRKKKKSYLWLILLAYVLIIALCIVPGLLYRLH